MRSDHSNDVWLGIVRPRQDCYAAGWNDAIARCSKRAEELAERIEASGQRALGRAVRRLALEFRGRDDDERGPKQRTAG